MALVLVVRHVLLSLHVIQVCAACELLTMMLMMCQALALMLLAHTQSSVTIFHLAR